MVMNKNLLHYDCISEFSYQFYKDLLTTAHLQTDKIHFAKMYGEDGFQDEALEFWGYMLIKDNEKYLLPQLVKNKRIQPSQVLPIRVNTTETVAASGKVYQLIKKMTPARFKPQSHMSFKEMVDYLSSFDHGNKDHQKLFWFLALTQVMSRANFRVSTPAGFGKDSVVDIIGNLIGGANTIENPSVPKLEERATAVNLLAVNEIVDIQKSQWRDIEQFLLATGAFKPVLTKRTRAHGQVGETIDISNFSLLLLYNDIDHYPSQDKYVDFVSKKAVLDRFPAFRLYGRFQEDFNAIAGTNIQTLVGNNIDNYRAIIESFTYYKKNLVPLQNGYKRNISGRYPERWLTNLDRLMNVIDLYCETQEEFDRWVKVIEESMADYKCMVKYPALVDKVVEKSESLYQSEQKHILEMATFKEKNAHLDCLFKGEKIIRDTKPLSDYDGEIL